jgi:hypothetical protein
MPRISSKPWSALGDPDWLWFVGVMLLPAGAALLFGFTRSASFFAGLAIYAGVMKWLGWLVLGRMATGWRAAVMFPAHILAGLAVAATWFYLRNLVALAWPASYALHELSILSITVAALHVGVALARLRSGRTPGNDAREAWWPDAIVRLTYFGLFAGLHVLALVDLSGSLDVAAFDHVHHGFSARVYYHDGVAYAGFNGGRPIVYPTGYGALNAIAAAAAPLTFVNAANMQLTFLCLAGAFLVVGCIAWAADRPGLALVFAGLLVGFLYVFPVYCLPDTYIEGSAKQPAPAFLSAVIALPLLPISSVSRFWMRAAVVAALSMLTAALNPACVPFVVLTDLAALACLCRHGSQLGIRRWLYLAGCAGLALALAALVVYCDPYYWRLLTDRSDIHDPGQPSEAKPIRPDVSAGLRSLRAATPLRTTIEFPDDDAGAWATGTLPGLLTLGTLCLLAVLWLRRSGSDHVVARCGRLLLWGLLAWIVLRYSVQLLIGSLPEDSWEAQLLRAYVGLILARVEIYLLLGWLLAALAVALLLPTSRRSWLVVVAALGVAAAAVAANFAVRTSKTLLALGHTDDPVYAISEDDRQLAAWIQRNLPADAGAIGLSALPCRPQHSNLEHTRSEKHLVPLAGARVLILYGRGYNFRFAQVNPGFAFAFDEYLERVWYVLDRKWCLDQGIAYFYITRTALGDTNVGLRHAIETGTLRPLKVFGASGVYEIVPP